MTTKKDILAKYLDTYNKKDEYSIWLVNCVQAYNNIVISSVKSFVSEEDARRYYNNCLSLISSWRGDNTVTIKKASPEPKGWLIDKTNIKEPLRRDII